ncbi:MAG TPA: hypothetical protein VHY79_05065 [Rhizomicrobium sp.]|nr:hypothetical protein [Rhizomicrobium sp.]
MNRAVADAPRKRRLSGLWKIRAAEPAGEATLILCLIPILLVPAFWNGFPLIYYDTGAYVLEGLGGVFLVERSPVYSLFLRFAGAGGSLWLIVLIQSAIVSFAITETTRAIAPRLPLALALLIGSSLLVGTGLPWYVGQVEPDCFTAIVVLSLYLLSFHRRTLGRVRIMLLIGVGAFAVAVHPSHLLLACFLLMFVVGLRLAVSGRAKPRFLEPAIMCVGGLALVLSANFGYTRQVFVSRAGPSFVFARMLQDGIVMRLLEDTCPKSGYRLCAYRDSLPATADGWLWTPYSPFVTLGHFQGTADDSARIVRDAILRYPLLQLEAAAKDAVEQFKHFATGDQIEPQEWVLAPVLTHYLPSQMNAYFSARQQRGEIRFRVISDLDVSVATVFLVAMVILLGWFLRACQFDAALFCGFVLAALIGNAAICGILSGPHDRYQSRLVWLAPFAVMLTVPLARRRHDQLG